MFENAAQGTAEDVDIDTYPLAVPRVCSSTRLASTSKPTSVVTTSTTPT
jgi:hypothetical protein